MILYKPIKSLDDMQEEIDIFNDGKVIVSNDQFTVSNKTYPLTAVTAVKVAEVKYKRGIGISMFMLLLGFVVLATLYDEHKGMLLGIMLIVVGSTATIAGIKTTQYTIVISSSFGDEETLVSTDKAYLDKVAQALNQHLVKKA